MASKPWLFASTAALLLAIGGGYYYFQPGDENNLYYCDVTGAAGVFRGGLSSTNYTAYPFVENKSSPEPCISAAKIKGKWSKINATFSCPSNTWAMTQEGITCLG